MSEEILRQIERLNADGETAHEEGRLDAALRTTREAYQLGRDARLDQSPAFVTTLNNLAFFSKAAGDIDAARRFFDEAVTNARRVFGTDHPDTATVLCNAASCYEALTQHSVAKWLWQEAHEIRRRVLGPDHPSTSAIEEVLMDPSYASAEPTSVKQEPESHETQVDNEVPLTVGQCFYSLARGDYETAAQMARNLMRSGEGRHAVVQTFLISMDRLGRRREVEEFGLAVVEDLQAHEPWVAMLIRLTLGLADADEALDMASDDIRRCQARFYYGCRLFTIGQLETARDQFELCMAMNAVCMERKLAELHRASLLIVPDSSRISETELKTKALNDQIAELQRQARYADALPLANAACDLVLECYGSDHVKYASALSVVAELYVALRRFGEAVPLYRNALEIYRSFGTRHPGYAKGLANLGELYWHMCRYAESEELLNETLTVIRNIFGERHRNYASALNNIASLYAEVGRDVEAASFFSKAAQIFVTELGELDPAYVSTLGNLAVVYRKLGRAADAEPLLRRVTEALRAAFGETHPDFLHALSNLAATEVALGRFVAAEGRYRRILAMVRETQTVNSSWFAVCVNNLARLCEMQGRLEEAEALFIEATETLEASVGKNHPEYAGVLSNLADLRLARGDYSEAEALQWQALEINRRTLGHAHPDCAKCLIGLSHVYVSLGQYSKAEPLSEQAIAIYRATAGEGHIDFAASLASLAHLHMSSGRIADAEALYEQALEINRAVLGETHPDYATALVNAATHYSSTDRSVEAYRQALEIYRTSLGEEHPKYAGVLHSLANLYVSKRSWAKAVPLYQRTVEILKTTLGAAHPDYAEALTALGGLYAQLGRRAESEAICHEAVAIYEGASPDPRKYAASLHQLGIVLVATAGTSAGLPFMERARRYEDRLIGQIFAVGSENQRMAYLDRLQIDFDVFLSAVYQHGSDAVWVNAAFEAVLKRKALGAEALAVQRDAVLRDRYPHLQETLRQLGAVRMQVARNVLQGPESGNAQQYQVQLAEWEKKREALERDLARSIPEITLEERLRTVDRHVLAGQLPAQATLIEFVRFDDFDFLAAPARGEWPFKAARYLAFVMSAAQPDAIEMIDLGDAELIDEQITTFHRTVRSAVEDEARDVAGSDAVRDDLLATLRGQLLDPVIERCHGLRPTEEKAQHLILAPDGDLALLPFEVLRFDDGRPLIDFYRISYQSTGRDILRSTTGCLREPNHAIVAGDPQFVWGSPCPSIPQQSNTDRHSRALDRTTRLAPLPGTRQEATDIAELLGVECWLGEVVLEARLKDHRSPRILHLATHGVFLEDPSIPKTAKGFRIVRRSSRTAPLSESPMLRSMLCLAGAQTFLDGGALPPEAEDGLLTAEDVAGMDLIDTELVVLSACDTGRGEVKVGEGVFGLRRAFAVAGARTLVMSLWKVPDEATRMLMIRFYEELQAGQSRIDALRTAQLYVRDRYPDPYYWGAFILQGEATTPLTFAIA
jgi:CHAT domain-containing protein/tetratricopeptide (TPR) repeat protein